MGSWIHRGVRLCRFPPHSCRLSRVRSRPASLVQEKKRHQAPELIGMFSCHISFSSVVEGSLRRYPCTACPMEQPGNIRRITKVGSRTTEMIISSPPLVTSTLSVLALISVSIA